MPTGMFHDNTTVQGAWLYSPTPSELSKKYSIPGYQRIIINVTMAMPHSGVFAAARDPINKIMQPQDLVVSKSSGLFVSS